jgi:Leucine-rich repeat (LRR) protein
MANKNPYLLTAETEGNFQMLENLKQLLYNEDANTALIGIEMLKKGGMPVVLHDDIVLLSKTANDAKTRGALRKLLEQYDNETMMPLYENSITFNNIKKAKEKDIRDKMAKMVKTVGWENTAKFAFLLFKHYEKGLSFILTYPKRNEFRVKALSLITQGDYFDFHKGVGYHNWKNTPPDEIILSSVNTGISFPEDHPDPLSIKTINMHNCKFDTLSKDIEVFQNVEELDLSVNNLKSLPLQFAKLKKLKSLNLSFNRLTSFPQALVNLEAIQVLDLRQNSSHAFKGEFSIAIQVPPDFREKHPNCEVLL